MSKPIIYAYDDTASWGKRLVEASRIQDVDARLFNSPEEVPDEDGVIAFIRMRNTLGMREDNKKLVEAISRKKKVKMLPTVGEGFLYDNKIAQHELFSKWMPETFYITSFEQAMDQLKKMKYPFVSKTSEGSGSKNTRLIANEKAAAGEAKKAFHRKGIPIHYGHKQKGYLIWQEFIPHFYDWRVIFLTKRYAYVVKRYNREEVPFSSGSGKRERIDDLTEEIQRLLDFSAKFFDEYRFSIAALDVASSENGRFFVLESSCFWGGIGETRSRIFEFNNDCRWSETKMLCDEAFSLIVGLIRDGGFNYLWNGKA